MTSFLISKCSVCGTHDQPERIVSGLCCRSKAKSAVLKDSCDSIPLKTSIGHYGSTDAARGVMTGYIPRDGAVEEKESAGRYGKDGSIYYRGTLESVRSLGGHLHTARIGDVTQAPAEIFIRELNPSDVLTVNIPKGNISYADAGVWADGINASSTNATIPTGSITAGTIAASVYERGVGSLVADTPVEFRSCGGQWITSSPEATTPAPKVYTLGVFIDELNRTGSKINASMNHTYTPEGFSELIRNDSTIKVVCIGAGLMETLLMDGIPFNNDKPGLEPQLGLVAYLHDRPVVTGGLSTHPLVDKFDGVIILREVSAQGLFISRS